MALRGHENDDNLKKAKSVSEKAQTTESEQPESNNDNQIPRGILRKISKEEYSYSQSRTL